LILLQSKLVHKLKTYGFSENQIEGYLGVIDESIKKEEPSMKMVINPANKSIITISRNKFFNVPAKMPVPECAATKELSKKLLFNSTIDKTLGKQSEKNQLSSELQLDSTTLNKTTNVFGVALKHNFEDTELFASLKK
jgi:hypothetical protein